MVRSNHGPAEGSKVRGWPFVAIALLGLLRAGPARSVPLEVYGHLPQIEDVALSPDGSQIAFVTTAGDDRVIVVGPLADPKSVFRLRVGDQKLRGIGWADNTHLMMRMSATYRSTIPIGGGGFVFFAKTAELSQLQVLDVPAKKATIVPNTNQVGASNGVHWLNAISGNPTVRTLGDHTVLFIRGVDLMLMPALFRLDLNTGVQTLLKQGTESTGGWVIGANGEVVAEEDYFEFQQQRWSVLARLNGNDTMTEVATGHSGIDTPSLLGFGPEPDTLVIEQVEDGANVWRLLSLRDGKVGPPMAEGKALQSPIESNKAHRMIGGVYVDDEPHYVFFDPAIQSKWDGILNAFSGEQVRLLSATDGLTKVVVLVQGARHGYAYYIIDLGTGHAKLLGPAYDGITHPLEVRRITYAAQDGFMVPAYLTLPAGRAEKGLPLVVLPHGGPEARDTAEFDWWSQAIADQGYAVLQPNFRGSTVSRKHLEAGFGEWGRKMQTDLSDGVRYLAKQGIIDPARVCIMGGSYGGYAALAGVTLDPGVYRCAISDAGLSDLRRMLSDKGWGMTQRYLDRFMGVNGRSDPVLDAISPLKHIDRITVPVLLIHGRDDSVVPFEQSQLMYDAMKHAGKDVQLVQLKHEDHWLSHSDTRLQMLQASVQFLRAHNPPD